MNKDPNRICQVAALDVDRAIFGLGRFIEYRQDQGMPDCDLIDYMQTYLNLTADLWGLERRSYAELLAQKVVVSPAIRAFLDRCTPRWLPDGERYRLYLRELEKYPNSDAPR